MRRPAAAAAIVVVSALGAAPADAVAATAHIVGVQESPSAPARGVVRYRAAPGEANRLTVLAVPGQPSVVELREVAVAIAPGPGCVAVEPVAVRCDGRAAVSPFGRQAASLERVVAELGDRADEATSRIDAGFPTPAPGLELRGDAGSDRLAGSEGASEALRGGSGPDDLRGRGGADVLAGGPGRDRVLAGAGDDFLEEGDESARDALDGGAGRDILDYRGRRRGVSVDLAARRGADRDRVAGVEGVSGGQGDDVLRGSARAEALRGGGGADRLAGRGGRDRLSGEEGRDVLSGGPDRDELDLSDGVRDGPDAQADRARCGRGLDLVAGAFAADRLAGDCERVLVAGESPEFFEVLVSQPLRAERAGTVAIRLADPRGDEEAPFRGRVALRFRGLLLGRPSRRVALRRNGRAVVRVRLVGPALSRLSASRRLTVQLVVGDASFTTILHAPRPRRGVGGGTPA